MRGETLHWSTILNGLRRAAGTCSVAGIVHGQKSTDFIKTLVER